MINTQNGERTRKLIIDYCLLKYKHEMKLKEYKIYLNDKLDLIIKDTEYISKQKIEFIRTAYEKLINTRFSNENTENVNDTAAIAEYIFNNLIEYFNNKNNTNKLSYLNNYLRHKSEILKYYKTYFDNRLKLKEFKEKQFQELRIISLQLIEDKTPIYVVTNIYKRLKTDLHILRHDSSELQYCIDEYDSLKEELIKQIKEIDKIF